VAAVADLWAFLTDPRNQATLSWLGVGLAGGLLGQRTPATRGSVVIAGDVTGSTVAGAPVPVQPPTAVMPGE
jgi:hypothetical protein